MLLSDISSLSLQLNSLGCKACGWKLRVEHLLEQAYYSLSASLEESITCIRDTS